MNWHTIVFAFLIVSFQQQHRNKMGKKEREKKKEQKKKTEERKKSKNKNE